RASTATLAPRTPTEAQLAAIWQEVLNLDSVGVSDNFFALGGHSLLAMKLVARIREAFGVDIAVPRVFEVADLAELAVEIQSRQCGDDNPTQTALADALAELGSLSPEELNALLAAEDP
ncbi:phosphopantetheine-binding protein, partial [Methylolobus aquaticus]